MTIPVVDDGVASGITSTDSGRSIEALTIVSAKSGHLPWSLFVDWLIRIWYESVLARPVFQLDQPHLLEDEPFAPLHVLGIFQRGPSFGVWQDQGQTHRLSRR